MQRPFIETCKSFPCNSFRLYTNYGRPFIYIQLAISAIPTIEYHSCTYIQTGINSVIKIDWSSCEAYLMFDDDDDDGRKRLEWNLFEFKCTFGLQVSIYQAQYKHILEKVNVLKFDVFAFLTFIPMSTNVWFCFEFFFYWTQKVLFKMI